MTASDVQPGDWVLTRAKVLELHPNDMDLRLEFFSKTDQWSGWVRRDLCDPSERPIPKEPADGTIVVLDGMAYQRLTDAWYRPGRPERRTWVELNQEGEPIVIDSP